MQLQPRTYDFPVMIAFYSRAACLWCFVFFFNDTATTEIYTLSLHDALPISGSVTGLIRLVTDALSYLVVNNKRPRTSTFSMVAKF